MRKNTANTCPFCALSDDTARSELRAMRDLVRHCWVHSGFADCGGRKMTDEQYRLYCKAIGRRYTRVRP